MHPPKKKLATKRAVSLLPIKQKMVVTQNSCHLFQKIVAYGNDKTKINTMLQNNRDNLGIFVSFFLNSLIRYQMTLEKNI